MRCVQRWRFFFFSISTGLFQILARMVWRDRFFFSPIFDQGKGGRAHILFRRIRYSDGIDFRQCHHFDQNLTSARTCHDVVYRLLARRGHTRRRKPTIITVFVFLHKL